MMPIFHASLFQALNSPVCQRLAQALLHFVWQGLAVLVIVQAVLAIWRRASARLRYATMTAGLAAMAACPVVTFMLIETPIEPAAVNQAHQPDVLGAGGPAPAVIVEDPAASSIVPAEAPPARSIATANRSPAWLARQHIAAMSPYCLMAWLAGLLALGGRLMLGVVHVRMLARSGLPLPDDLRACAARLFGRLRIARPPGVFLSDRVREAVALGLWRPVVLIPLAWAAQMPVEALEAVIAHELAHIRRWDLWISLGQRVIETLLFYHPAVWWLSRRISAEREICADELAVFATGQRFTYAEMLGMVGLRHMGQTVPQPSLGLGDQKMKLLDRVRNVLGIVPSHRQWRWWPAGLLAMAAPVLIWLISSGAVRPAHAGPPQDLVSQPASVAIEVTGQVVDDQTGKPVKTFSQQGGRVDEQDPSRVTWGYYMLENAGDSNGRFSARIDYAQGWRARIIAGGYVPQPILVSAPPEGIKKIDGVVIRMKRGRQVAGRVLDFAGKPVENAAVFVVGSRPLNITGGKALGSAGGPDAEEDKTVRPARTGKDGRFSVTGVGEDAQRLAVSADGFDLWVEPIPPGDAPTDNLDIRLPEPGLLILKYDMPGGADEARFFLQLHTWEMPGYRSLDNCRYVTVKRGQNLELSNMPSGDYEIVRQKELKFKTFDRCAFLDRRTVRITSGQGIITTFRRPTGAPVAGRIVGLDRDEIAKTHPTGIVVTVKLLNDSRRLAPTFDEIGLKPDDKAFDGSFTTERMPPGQYKITADVYIPETEEQRRSTGIVPPAFTGDVTVTVPEAGAPEPVKIELGPWSPRRAEQPATAPAAKAPTLQLRFEAKPGEEAAADLFIDPNDRGRQQKMRILREVLIDETGIAGAAVQAGFNGQPQVLITFTPEAAKKFAGITEANIGRRLAIILSGKLVSAPVIRSAIPGGKCVIDGNFTNEEAQAIADAFNAGAKQRPQTAPTTRAAARSPARSAGMVEGG